MYTFEFYPSNVMFLIEHTIKTVHSPGHLTHLRRRMMLVTVIVCLFRMMHFQLALERAMQSD